VTGPGAGATHPQRPDGPLLVVHALERHFGAVRAVDGVSFELDHGEVLSIIGPNGSGKTTTINLLSGLLRRHGGTITLNGRRVERLSAERRAELGVARTFQNGRVFAHMAVGDNVYVGAYRALRVSRPFPRLRHVAVARWASLLGELLMAIVQPPAVRREQAQAHEQVRAQLSMFGERLAPRENDLAYSLSYANRRRTEIARALVADPVLLLLDEPTAGMNPTETAEVLSQLLELKAAGQTMVLVEHKIDLVMTLSDRVVVMDNGSVIADGPPSAVRDDERVIEAYLGSRHRRSEEAVQIDQAVVSAEMAAASEAM
jgi:branched-chain amino acid transport system ATP-binding protein